MGQIFGDLSESLAEWLVAQPVFFVATAPLEEGMVNCSPKGNRHEFAVLSERTAAYLDQTGSGIETIAHLRENGRIVLMFCAFDGPPRIVRLHGEGRAVFSDSPEFAALTKHFPGAAGVGVRSIIVVAVERISDSWLRSAAHVIRAARPTMDQWSRRKGPEGIRDYRAQNNRTSVDDLEGLDIP
jgi:hypothetical protein